MFVLTAILGGLLYPAYRIDVRVLLEDTNSRSAQRHLRDQGTPHRGRARRAPRLLAGVAHAACPLSSRRRAAISRGSWRSSSGGRSSSVTCSTTSRGCCLIDMKVFSLLFGAIYYFCVWKIDWALFYYYPETKRWYLTAHPNDGAAILWYGWLATAALISIPIALLVPRRIADRLSE